MTTDQDMEQALQERDDAQDALATTHIALGGDGEWVARIPSEPAPNSGDLHHDVPALAELRITELANERETAGNMRVTLVYVRGMLAAIKGAVDAGHYAAIPAIVDEAREKIQAVIRPVA